MQAALQNSSMLCWKGEKKTLWINEDKCDCRCRDLKHKTKHWENSAGQATYEDVNSVILHLKHWHTSFWRIVLVNIFYVSVTFPMLPFTGTGPLWVTDAWLMDNVWETGGMDREGFARSSGAAGIFSWMGMGYSCLCAIFPHPPPRAATSGAVWSWAELGATEQTQSQWGRLATALPTPAWTTAASGVLWGLCTFPTVQISHKLYSVLTWEFLVLFGIHS